MRTQSHRFFSSILEHFPQKKDEVLQALSKFFQGMQPPEEHHVHAAQAVLGNSQTGEPLQKSEKVFAGAPAVLGGQRAPYLMNQGEIGRTGGFSNATVDFKNNSTAVRAPIAPQGQVAVEASNATETDNDASCDRNSTLRGAQDVEMMHTEGRSALPVLKEENPKKSMLEPRLGDTELEIAGVRAKTNKCDAELEQPLEDRIASMPRINMLLDQLRRIVTQPSTSGLLGEGISQDSSAGTDAQRNWLVFMRNYLRNADQKHKSEHVDSESAKIEPTLEDNLWRMEQRAAAKDLELEQRFRTQGIDITILPPEVFRECLKGEEERLTKELGSYGLISSSVVGAHAGSSSLNEGMGTWNSNHVGTVMDPGTSTIDDIDGDKFGSFDDAAWILLTSQRPASVASGGSPGAEASAPSKKQSKDGSLTVPTARKNQAASNGSMQLAGAANNSQGSTGQIVEKGQSRPASRQATLQQDSNSYQGLPFYASAQSGGQAQNQTVLPQKRYAHTACLIEDSRLFIYGGVHRTGSGQAPFHSFYECHLKLDSARGEDLFRWRKIQVETPKTRDSHSCVAFHDQHLLIFGGSCDGKSYNDLYKYTVAARMWTKLEPICDDPSDMPCPREGHIAVLLESDKMVVHGGINEENECFNDAFVLVGLHEEIDLAQSQIKYDEKGRVINALELKQLRGKKEMLRWIKCSQEGDVPSARDSHSATLFNGQVFIFGGQDKDEHVLDDFYYFSMQQGSVEKTADDLETGQTVSYVDRTFKLVWSQIHYNSVRNGTNPSRWPVKRSSHTMSLFKNRFLVLVGGETTNEEDAEGKSSKSKQKKKDDVSENKGGDDDANSDKDAGSNESEENANQSLADVWLFDLQLHTWQELKPSIRVQPIFNNKKMRKTFEPRMAHTATVVHGNYIVFFGGYCGQNSKYSHANFAVLSLTGCTDYILSKPNTMVMVRELFLQRALLKQEKEQEKPAPLFAITGGNNQNKQGRKPRKQNNNISLSLSGTFKPLQANQFFVSNQSAQAHTETAATSSVKSNVKQKKQQQADKVPEVVELPKPTGISFGAQVTLIQSNYNNRMRLSSPSAARRRVIDVNKLPNGEVHPLDHVCLLLRHFIASYRRDYLTLNEEPDERPQLADRAEKLCIDIARYKKVFALRENLDVFSIDEKGRGMLFKDFQDLIQSTGFVSLVKKLGRCALVISKAERVSRRNNSGLQRVLSQKQRECAEDQVVFEVHVGMVSFDFCSDSQLSVPFVSYHLQRDSEGSYQFIEQTPLADRFLNLMVHYSGAFESAGDLKNHLRTTCFERNAFRPGTLMLFTNLHNDMKGAGSDSKISAIAGDIVCKQKSLHNVIQTQYIDFPENVLMTLRNYDKACADVSGNPFKLLIKKINSSKQTQQYAIRGGTGQFQYWLIEEAKLKLLIRERDNLRRFNGVLIFMMNEYVMTDVMCQPAAKRILEPMMASDDKDEEILTQRVHGIVMIDRQCSSNGLMEPLEIPSDLLTEIRHEVWSAYTRWKLPNQQRPAAEGQVKDKENASVDETVTHEPIKRSQPFQAQQHRDVDEDEAAGEDEENEEEQVDRQWQMLPPHQLKRQKIYHPAHRQGFNEAMPPAAYMQQQMAAQQHHPIYAQYAAAHQMIDDGECLEPIMLQQPLMAPSQCPTLDTEQQLLMLTPSTAAYAQMQQQQQAPLSPYLTKEEFNELSPEDQQQYYMQMTEYINWAQQNEVADHNPEELDGESPYEQQPESEVPPEEYYNEGGPQQRM